MLTPKKKQTIIKKAQMHEGDTGSSHVQAAVLAQRIEELSGHLKKHPKDNHSRRGLIKLVSERRKHEKYAATQKPGTGAGTKKPAKKAASKPAPKKAGAKKASTKKAAAKKAAKKAATKKK